MSAMESLAAPIAEATLARPKMRDVRIWLFAVAALVFAMVLVGGATRLTESGLSITQWKPVTGVVPPLGEAEWQAEFARYKQIPQYSQLNPDMDLDGFKTIFYWEWSHRLLARIIGLAFILPLLWFWRRGQLAGALGRQVLVATGLLALEPIVGWWMVASGLSERVEVSQYRLTLHLLIGTATFGALLWAAVGLRQRPRAAASRRFAALSGLIAILVFCQIGFGALVAGLRAGLIYNTWPLMDGRLIPEGLFNLSPWWRNLFEDVTTVQFQHRLLAYVVVALALWQAFAVARAAPGTALARRAAAVGALALSQAALGVLALLLVVPIWAGLLHQAFAMLLFGMAVVNWKATGDEAHARQQS
ncbi:COX15/CtaA family protein [Methylocapsa sp. S129]|uniref:COX15/CtaA family protein n=1 Tax=Methylocapsa sp. S129 TaxID=1641869 RepID=UPI00131DA4D4|nr:COX15/CtaA family protein [Methylocapsa sp. S129]